MLKQIKEIDPNVEVIMVTAVKEVQTAVQAIKLGANEYIMKPFVVDDIVTAVDRALEKRRLVKEVTYLRQELERYQPFEKMVGQDPSLLKIFELIATVSQSDGAVLIQGESGTGKELVARAIHNRSPRHADPFVVINCAAIPVTLMESELFGHTKGAFTGATSASIGKLEMAHKGTIFFDDIDSLEVNMQAKLLRVIQEKEFERLGSNKVIRIDVRFVAASNKDIKELILKEKFRDDLFYRLNVFPIELPPLRERRGDIPLLLEHFLALQAQKTGKALKRFNEKAVKALSEYDWPGNVRELQNLVERLFAITPGNIISIEDASPFNIRKRTVPIVPLKKAVRNFEQATVCIEPMVQLGYEYRGEHGVPRRHLFVQGDPRTHHVHVNEVHSKNWEALVLFRDYMIQHPEMAQEYAKLKQELAQQFPTDRPAYLEKKSGLIERVLQSARSQRRKT